MSTWKILSDLWGLWERETLKMNTRLPANVKRDGGDLKRSSFGKKDEFSLEHGRGT